MLAVPMTIQLGLWKEGCGTSRYHDVFLLKQTVESFLPVYLLRLCFLARPTQLARYGCVVHWGKLEKPRSEEEAEDTRARLQRRCVRISQGFVPDALLPMSSVFA